MVCVSSRFGLKKIPDSVVLFWFFCVLCGNITESACFAVNDIGAYTTVSHQEKVDDRVK